MALRQRDINNTQFVWLIKSYAWRVWRFDSALRGMRARDERTSGSRGGGGGEALHSLRFVTSQVLEVTEGRSTSPRTYQVLPRHFVTQEGQDWWGRW